MGLKSIWRAARVATLSWSVLQGSIDRCGFAAEPATSSELPRHVRMAARIDQLLAESWTAKGIVPAEGASDAEFLRRVNLDLVGVIPTVAESREFLADADPQKRAQQIERLLHSQRHADHLATTWRNMMVPRDAMNGVDGLAGLQNWLRKQFLANKRYDQMVADLMVATGAAQDGPALYYTAFDLKPEELAANTARVFLGVQIECAQCHNHPFDRWTQEDFWGYAAFFARLERPNMEQPGRAIRLVDRSDGEVTLPNTQNVVLPRYPRGDAADAGEGGTRRMQLGIWMVSRDNPFTARAAVNRVWAHLFGRGLVEPVDDIADHNPAIHPQLFQELSQYFVETGYDLRNLFRTLANTQAYQHSSRGQSTALDRPQLFERMPVRTLSPEQFYDSLSRAGLFASAAPSAMDNVGGFDVRRQQFVDKMQSQTASRLDYDAGVAQVLLLMNGEDVGAAVNQPGSGLLAALEAPGFEQRDRIEVVFLATLSRLPTPNELKRVRDHLDKAESDAAKREALGDLVWALVNSAEFSLNH